jgi:hypothetical protein
MIPARITFRVNAMGNLQPFADGKPIETQACTIVSAIGRPGLARIDVLLPDGLVMEPEAPNPDRDPDT